MTMMLLIVSVLVRLCFCLVRLLELSFVAWAALCLLSLLILLFVVQCRDFGLW